MLSDIVHVNKENDKKLFTIDQSRHSKRVKKDKLLQILKQNGFDQYTAKSSYIQFTKKSPIDTTKIKKKIRQFYQNKYQEIQISSITLMPLHYLSELPNSYTVHLNKRAYLMNKGVVHIKTLDNKKIFFQYHIKATLPVITARVDIKKESEIQRLNTRKKSIMLNKFRAMPLQSLHVSEYQAKHNIKADTILTKRDVLGLYLVKRGANVNVNLKSQGISIFFSAKALQNGRLGDTISVRKNNTKSLRVVVTGKNKAEIK